MKSNSLARSLLLAGFFVAASLLGWAAATTNSPATNAPATVTSAASTNAPDVTTAKKPFLSITTGDSDDDDGSDKHSDHDDFWGDMIPIAGIVGSFGMPLLIVVAVFYFRHRRRTEQFALAREFLAKGMPVPPQLLDDSRCDPTDVVSPDQGNQTVGQRDLRKGFRLAFIGLGLCLALYVEWPHDSTWGWGLIPAVMGLGFIASGVMQGGWQPRSRGQDLPPRPPGR